MFWSIEIKSVMTYSILCKLHILVKSVPLLNKIIQMINLKNKT